MIKKEYTTFIDFLRDVEKMSESFDFKKTFNMKSLSFYTKDGNIFHGATFPLYLRKMREILGIPFLDKGSNMSGVIRTFYEVEDKSQLYSEPKILVEDLSVKTKNELSEIAKAKGLEVKPTMKKEDIITLINAVG